MFSVAVRLPTMRGTAAGGWPEPSENAVNPVLPPVKPPWKQSVFSGFFFVLLSSRHFQSITKSLATQRQHNHNDKSNVGLCQYKIDPLFWSIACVLKTEKTMVEAKHPSRRYAVRLSKIFLNFQTIRYCVFLLLLDIKYLYLLTGITAHGVKQCKIEEFLYQNQLSIRIINNN